MEGNLNASAKEIFKNSSDRLLTELYAILHSTFVVRSQAKSINGVSLYSGLKKIKFLIF